MSARKKVPPPIPVVGGQGGGDDSREEQLRQWEDNQRRLREQQAAAVLPAAAPVAPAAVVPAQAPQVVAEAAALSEVPAVTEPVTARAADTGYLPMPEFTEPDSEDPADRLEFYSRGIFAVQYAARANHERAEQQRLIGLGLRLRAVKEEELHKTAGFETFGDLTDARFQIKKHQANNIIRVLGVAQALEDITTQELKERPLRVLVPILDTHGAQAVRRTWEEAARHGNVTDTALKQAANFLGYAPPKELPALDEGKETAGLRTVSRPSESLRAVERIRALAEKDPDQARRQAEELENAVRELLEELSGNLG
ncbi:hypothetical protein PV382_23845 [Streptomyces scabiei]|uniref:hypothetical protein n=1 Tax=Streptomyces scabiei TaxID=1930 RepID=UPI000765909B|nr:hypothetical protein [Streptomyces scabiei]MDX2658320.1 hypothetical protein [Streptomyces scabiei]MDX2870605.1 hypothetical protein [Streptomyces scabiei]MDX2999382.1 hypothetical protein [Streptomyces scabiei]MDX3053000.1 hypothetical protein [Streptomyces scabiei]MDX3175286.1 hypothetical protein [Streptomyces scabiei]